MKNRKNNPISFGITLVSANQTEAANTDLKRRNAAVHSENAIPGRIKQMSIHEFDCPRKKIPPQNKPFTPDLFITEPVTLPAFPPPWKMSPKEERVQKEMERFRSRTSSPRLRARTAWYPASKKTSSPVASDAWEFFKIACFGIFVVLKYTFIAISLIITIGCMICAGRRTREVKYRW